MTRGRAPSAVTGTQFAVRVGLAALLGYAAVTKLLDLSGFAEDIQNYRVLPDAWAGLLAVVLPVLELAVAVGLLTTSHAQGGAALSALMLFAFALAMAQAKVRGIDVECGCFGGQSRVSWWKIAMNVALAAMAVWTVWAAGAARRAAVLDEAR